jgi:hypothetical protein
VHSDRREEEIALRRRRKQKFADSALELWHIGSLSKKVQLLLVILETVRLEDLRNSAA